MFKVVTSLEVLKMCVFVLFFFLFLQVEKVACCLSCDKFGSVERCLLLCVFVLKV